MLRFKRVRELTPSRENEIYSKAPHLLERLGKELSKDESWRYQGRRILWTVDNSLNVFDITDLVVLDYKYRPFEKVMYHGKVAMINSYRLDEKTMSVFYDISIVGSTQIAICIPEEQLEKICESEMIGMEITNMVQQKLYKDKEEDKKEMPVEMSNIITLVAQLNQGAEESIEDKIKSVQFNAKKGVTTVVLKDGTKGMSRCNKEDEYDMQIGFSVALTNALFGSRTQAIKYVDKALEKQTYRYNKRHKNNKEEK